MVNGQHAMLLTLSGKIALITLRLPLRMQQWLRSPSQGGCPGSLGASNDVATNISPPHIIGGTSNAMARVTDILTRERSQAQCDG